MGAERWGVIEDRCVVNGVEWDDGNDGMRIHIRIHL